MATKTKSITKEKRKETKKKVKKIKKYIAKGKVAIYVDSLKKWKFIKRPENPLKRIVSPVLLQIAEEDALLYKDYLEKERIILRYSGIPGYYYLDKKMKKNLNKKKFR